MKTCLILHCDLAGRPYRIEDFRAPLQDFGVLKDIGGIVPLEMGHVWLVNLRTQEARQRLITAGGMQVKGRFSAIIDPVHHEQTIKVDWVPFRVSDEAVRWTFTDFGDVKDVRQDAWGAADFESAESTTGWCVLRYARTYRLTNSRTFSNFTGVLCLLSCQGVRLFACVVVERAILGRTAEF